MPRVPDLVRDSKLETSFDQNQTITIHNYVETDPNRRRIFRQEYWKLERHLGQGSYGQVQLEKCLSVRLRAVKKVMKRPGPNSVDYSRELEAVAKFSHPKVSQD
jgi:hypothetical protein